MRVQTVWPGGWVELPGFDDPVEVPLVMFGPGKMRTAGGDARPTGDARPRVRARAGKKPLPAWLEGYLRETWSRR